MPEELEAIRRGLSALGDPRAAGTPSRCFQGIAQKARGSCFSFSSPKEEKHTKPPTTKSTAAASVGADAESTEPVSAGTDQPTDAGDRARIARAAAPSSRNRVLSGLRAIVLTLPTAVSPAARGS